jgi:O-succinylbenzoic acid--CoA ligase
VRQALSIFAAAREAPDTVGLHIGEQRFTFAELAELTQVRLRLLEPDVRDGAPYPLTATNTLETVVTLYALLERRVPALLLHPRLTVSECDAQVQAAARVGGAAHTDAAAVIYTSGTTGHPRGAVLTRAALVASARASAANLGWRNDDCWLLCMLLARVGGLSIVTRCLAARRPFALVPRFEAGSFPGLVEQHRASLISVVPTMLSLLLDAHPAWVAPPYLRAILLGGALASPNLLRRARQRELPIVITYGLTETCSQVVATPYELRHDPEGCGAGRPLAGAQIRIVDGRIHIRGPMLMAGYLDEPALERDAWFDTGDLGEIDARGCLHVHARLADLIVTGGENVYPAEVERVLESCPGVMAAAVFGVPDPTWGHTVAAALVAESVAPSDAALRAYISAHLSPSKRPRDIFFVPHLPHTPAGKLDREALVAICREPSSARAAPAGLDLTALTARH